MGVRGQEGGMRCSQVPVLPIQLRLPHPAASSMGVLGGGSRCGGGSRGPGLLGKEGEPSRALQEQKA